jgi:hypothetical protein
MCAPVAAIGAITGIVSAVTGIIGTIATIQYQNEQLAAQQRQEAAQADQYRAEADRARAEAQIAERDAIAAKINAGTELRKSAAEAQVKRAETRTAKARQFAQLSAAGVDPFQGSAALVVNETEARGRLDALTSIWGGEATHTSYQNEAKDLEIQRDNLVSSSTNYERGANTLGGGTYPAGSYVSIMARQGKA